VNLSYLPVAWRQHPMIERIDAQTVSGHPLSENRIRYFIKWDNRTGQGGIEYEIHEAYIFIFSASGHQVGLWSATAP